MPAQRAATAVLADRPTHRILCVLDEFPLLLAGDDAISTEALTRLESVARRGRSAGVHLILTSRPAPALAALRARRDSLFGQFPVRVALPGGADVLEPTNDAAAGLPLGTAVVNTAGGLGGPRGAVRGHERMVRFPDPHADPGALAALRHRLWAARPAGAPGPAVFTGYLTPPAPPAPADGAAAALVGMLVEVTPRPAEVPLDPSPGRHLAVLGPDPAGAGVLIGAARGLAARRTAGDVRFVIAAPGTDPAARALATELARRHPVDLVDAAGLAGALDLAGPGYLVVFGMDELAPGDLPEERFRALLRDGPARGVHLLSWWRAVDRFADRLGTPADPDPPPPATREPDLDPSANLEPEAGDGPDGAAGATVDGLLFLDVPEPQVARLVGRPVPWHPRPGRALLYDRRTGRTSLVVPYAAPGGEGTA